MQLKVEIKTPEQLRRIWMVDGILGVVAGIVLILAIASAFGVFVPRGTFSEGRQKRNGDENAALAKVESPLVVEGKAFTAKWLTPPPPPKVPDPPKTTKKDPPKEVKPVAPTPPPQPVIPPPPPIQPPPPAPKFSVVATIVADNGYGWAWIQKPGKPESELVFAGDEVEGYTIANIEEGKVTVFIKGLKKWHEYNLEVPKPAAGAVALAPLPQPGQPMVTPSPIQPNGSRPGVPPRPEIKRPERTIPNRRVPDRKDG